MARQYGTLPSTTRNGLKANSRFDHGARVSVHSPGSSRVRPALVEPAPGLKILYRSLFLDCDSPFFMWVGPGLASAQFTFLAGFCAASGATNR
jgi:hypothetical protein